MESGCNHIKIAKMAAEVGSSLLVNITKHPIILYQEREEETDEILKYPNQRKSNTCK